MSKPATLNLDITQGEDFTLGLTLAENDVAVDITGWTFSGQIKTRASDVTPLAEFDFTITDASAGEVSVTLADTDTASLPPGKWVYDWWVRYGASIDAPVCGGIVTVHARVSA